MTIGIMSAMPEEAHLLSKELRREAEYSHGGRTYYTGHLMGKKVVLVFSRMGKVAAAATVQHLIDIHRVSSVIFTGVAGALDSRLKIGDVVVAERLWQHDMDASPIFPALEIPLLGMSSFRADEPIAEQLKFAATEFLRMEFSHAIEPRVRAELGIGNPRVHFGDIASGDRFVATGAERAAVRSKVPSALCVEMEGAAVSQVCFEQNIPLGVVRVISDSADEKAAIDFQKFVREAASHYGLGILKHLLNSRERSHGSHAR